MMYEQLYEYLNNYLIDLLCSFCKAHLTQHIFSRLIRSLKKGPDNSGLVGTILMDLSKAYDCLLYDLSIAKLDAYGLDKPSLNLVNGYFRFWKQTEKIGSAYSDCYQGPSSEIHPTAFSYLLKNLIYANLLTITQLLYWSELKYKFIGFASNSFTLISVDSKVFQCIHKNQDTSLLFYIDKSPLHKTMNIVNMPNTPQQKVGIQYLFIVLYR